MSKKKKGSRAPYDSYDDYDDYGSAGFYGVGGRRWDDGYSSKWGGGFWSNLAKQLSLRTVITPQLLDSDVDLLYARVRAHLDALPQYQQAPDNVKHYIDQVITEELVHDIFSVYYTPDTTMKINPSVNPVRYTLINYLFNYMIRAMTQKNAVRSYFFMREIITYLVMVILNAVNKSGGDPSEGMKKMLSLLGKSRNPGEDTGEAQGALDAMLKGSDRDGRQLQQHLNTATHEANEGENFMKSFGKTAGTGTAEEIRVAVKLEEFLKQLRAINASRGPIEQLLRNILRTGVSHFQLVKGYNEEPLIDTSQSNPEILDLHYLVPLVPSLRGLLLTEVGVRSPQYAKKIRVYIDVSGSMGNTSQPKSQLVKAKAVALILMRMDIVEGVYFFDDGVHDKMFTDPFDILAYERGGGTNFTKVITHAVKGARDTIVITDGEGGHDNYTYSKRIFWVGVGGASFDCFNRPDSEKGMSYVYNSQCVVIDDKGTCEDYKVLLARARERATGRSR